MSLSKKYTVIIAEDDIFQRQVLIHFLKEVNNLEIIDSVSSGERLVESYKRHNADIIVIDIGLHKKDGITAAKEILSFSTPQIIVVTGNTDRDNLLIGYELNFVGYILKPVDKLKFIRAIQEAVKRTEARLLTSIASVNQAEVRWINCRYKYRDQQIPEHLIVHIKKEDKYLSHIHLADGGIVKTSTTLKEIEKQCSNNVFRSHKSYLVNIKYIRAVYANIHTPGSYDITLSNSMDVLPLSSKYYPDYLAKIRLRDNPKIE
ncbi:two component transcriptional regulator, LytTR family [Paenibacillus tianmuensis]|uniref:Two component transcriptional regulator, LytTR family n=1 Tax=Paenibacillus tianmuensis TaxID=624147 RepID=A0A1G4TBJ4_9BACL|nr:LytTR family DNA-binding domain-containing protein [Paenibacillus tianmuensis]SCW78814.1 two component transcriptional regulator, LytTR family [Paenibacillus tianmuensis]